MTGPVLFCFDGSDGSLRALSDGGALLARRAAVVLTVWETVATQLASSGFGYVADEIDAPLIVCGARGRNAAKRALLGSVAEAVLHRSHRPTLIAPQPDDPNVPR